MIEIIQDIKPRGLISAYVDAPFDQGKEALSKEGYRIISLQENARLRMQEGAKAHVSKYGNWTKEGVLYLPKKGRFLTKNSPIMTNAQEATECHRNGRDFYLTDEQVQESLANSVELNEKEIPTKRFGENEVTVYAFGEDAEEYGQFLKEQGINEMPIWLADVKDIPFARQGWLGSVVDGGRSSLLGDSRDLDYYDHVRGVRDSAEGTANLEAYTARIEGALKEPGFSEVSKSLVDRLRNE